MNNFEPSSGQIQSIMSFSNIKAMFITIDMPQYPSCDPYHSLIIEKVNINDKKYWYGQNDGPKENQDNILYSTTLFKGSKGVKTYYPNKYIFAWKLATDDSFMQGYKSSRLGARTNIQTILNTQIITGIIDNLKINDDTIYPENQNTLEGFIGTRSYSMSWQVSQTPMLHFLYDAVIRIMFDDNPDPEVLNLEVIGEISGSMITAG
ncbi:MAG: hypothetical protein EZS28_003112 [Streblomastix strix]|uniref:Uncharacterized protein n=1 Tax=Streblomastix strix TaxID=222440 RepID=A0A5J4X4B8_9EUKA|nr:MAG: hypothetical protein EZS28_003112 [Streblomastix strix]